MAQWIPALPALVPVAFVAVWYLISRRYPRSDEGHYMMLSQQIYYANDGWWLPEYFSNAYLLRMWKPILHPLLGYLALELTRGRVLAAMALSGFAFYLIYVGHVFAIGRQFLSIGRSALLVALLGSIPWVFNSAFGFNSEMPLLACAMAALHHLLKSDWFKSPSSSLKFGIWLGLGLCVRPVEMFLVFVIPLTVTIVKAFQKKTIKPRDLLATFGVLIFGSAVLAIPIIRQQDLYENPSAVFLMVSAVLAPYGVLLLLDRRKEFSRAYFKGFSAAYLVSFLWYAPASMWLHRWIYTATYSEFTRATGQRQGVSAFEHTVNIMSNVGGLTVAMLVIAALAAFALRTRAKAPAFWVLACLVGMILLPIALGCVTYNGDYRYYYLSMAVLILALGTVILREPESRGARKRADIGGAWAAPAAVALVAGVQIFHAFCCFRGYPAITSLQYVVRPAPEPDQAGEILDGMKGVVPDDINQIGLLQIPAEDGNDLFRDPFALTVIGRERGYHEREISMPFLYGSPRDRYLAEVLRYPYILVGAVEGKGDHEPVSILGKEIVGYWKNDRLAEKGLRFVKEIKYYDKMRHEPVTMLLLKRRDD